MIDPVALLDLTSLGDADTADDVRRLCARAVAPRGEAEAARDEDERPRSPVAAVCVLPGLAAVAVEELRGTPVRVATVVDFPAGEGGAARAAEEVGAAVAVGVDELDVVVPWRAHLAGDHDAVGSTVAACVAAARGRPVKAILETGSHPDATTTRAMADAALAAGAAFVKTSTGKRGAGATPAAARVLLEAVRDHGAGGVKVSGGVRTAADADTYISLAAEVCGATWVTPATFRIGASSLLDALLADPGARGGSTAAHASVDPPRGPLGRVEGGR